MNVFEIIGPVMVGPSSSHTAGAVRIGKIAREILGCQPERAEIVMHGSFAQTYKGHGTDKAVIAGLLGMSPDDERIRNSMQLASQSGLQYTITTGVIRDAHPNTVLIKATGINGRRISVVGSSIGGGNILIKRINEMEVEFSAEYETLIIAHHDAPGTIAAIARLIADNNINIASMKVYRSCRGGRAIMIIETDQEVDDGLEQAIGCLPETYSTTLIRHI